ncbi:MAG: sigma-70 family RNA polymerase sigma factor [Woeseiaceae bacterium]|nr:sigma-70 family RNA polymerase sigma factor [Woeseiaceae bacterium]
MNSKEVDTTRRRRFDRVVSIYYKDMYRYAAWLCRDPSVAEVVVQESMLRAWKALDSLRDDGAAKHWLLTIVRRENGRYFAGAKPEMLDIDDLTPRQNEMISTTDDPDLEEMRQAIYTLEDDYREPLVLQVLMGYSTEEIAAMLGIKRGAVLTRLYRARRKLKETIYEAAAA